MLRGELQLRASAGLSQSLSRNIKAACFPGQDLNSGLSEVKTQTDPRNVRISKYQEKRSLNPRPLTSTLHRWEAEVQKREPPLKNAE